MHKQTLYKIHSEHLKETEVKTKNRNKKFEYGYNPQLDCVIISKDGTLGDIYEVQGLRIGIPLAPKECDGSELEKEDQVFIRTPKPATLGKIKTIYDFQEQPEELKLKYTEYSNQEFDRREFGYWFMCNGEPCYLSGSHYMYLNWTKIDVGHPDFRQANRIFFYFWEACKADDRSLGMCYLKNRRSGFSFMASSETVNLATQTSDSRYGILSKTGSDAKKMFTDKVVPININYPFFFKPVQAGEERPKTELAYKVPSRKLTRKTMKANSDGDMTATGLDTTIDWKNTGDNSYDGEKLQLLVHDESGKWEKPDNILNNWRVTRTCLITGSNVVGKCMMGSTSNALSKGGENFKKLYYDSCLVTGKRNRNGRTKSGLYALFLPMEWGYEGFIDKYGYPVFETPKEPVEGIDGKFINEGVIEFWENEVEGLKGDSDGLNEFYRQFPRSEKHAFRDEAVNSLFNLTRIYEQIDHNEIIKLETQVSRGSFRWSGAPFTSEVVWSPHKDGRFVVSWIPPKHLQNQVKIKNGHKYPGNDGLGVFGCDSYDISGVVGGGGSNGALHGVTAFSMEPGVPSNQFFLEYVARPQTSEIFFDDVLKACVFYGMPILAENNKPRLLYYFKQNGFRGYSMNRPDRTFQQMSKSEKELGGIPNSSEDIKQAHAAAIESYIEEYVGQLENGMGNMPFQRTLQDWAGFDISNRTKFDASISSGLALMGVRKHFYRPHAARQTKTIDFSGVLGGAFDNSGNTSRRMNH